MSALPVTSLGPIIRGADAEANVRMKDKSYRRCPIGQEVGRYLRDCRWAGLAENSLLAYETVLARFAIDHDDLDSLDFFCSPVGAEYLMDFLHRHWQDSAAGTKAQRTKILRGFFAWAAAKHRIPYDPSATLKAGRGGGRKLRNAYPRTVLHRLLTSQETLRDEVALELVYRLAMRREDIRLLQVRDVDLARGRVNLLHGKGGHEDSLALGYPDLRERLYLHIQGEGREPDEFLLYARERRRDPMSRAGVHNWFKRCLRRADLPETIQLHELRHTALDEMYRETSDIVKASQLARHENPGTTWTYLHPLEDDLREAMRAVDEAWRVFSSETGEEA